MPDCVVCSELVGGVESCCGGVGKQPAVQPEHVVAWVLGAEVVEDGHGGGMEEWPALAAAKPGIGPGPGVKPFLQDLGQMGGEELFLEGCVGGFETMRPGCLEQVEMI